MSFLLGVVLFAIGITGSVALHEAGHMWTAKAFGMRVRRYFIGFGPSIFSFRRGATEYGLKAIPAGGFCDIAGMTALDPVTPEEAPHAFFRKPTWQRVIVLSAGSMAHFMIGMLLIYALAITTGLPVISDDPAAIPPVVGSTVCVPTKQDKATGELTQCKPNAPSPATVAHLQPGDRIISVDGKPTNSFAEVSAEIRQHTSDEPAQLVLERAGQRLSVPVQTVKVERLAAGAVPGRPDNRVETVGAIGVAPKLIFSYGPLAAVPATFDYTCQSFGQVWKGLLMFPEKIPAVIRAIGGAPPDLNRPVSVVGASIIGGDAAEQGRWLTFVLLLAVLNFFIGVFNLLPLLPLDGGHIAVNLYQHIRDVVRERLGKTKMPPVDYTRLLPLTYAFVLVLATISLLTITADIVNPIRLPQ
ncbi:MAG: site-2 protease family protein [Pseudonocardia sp.]|nr:site-2 protease family protein [Pseudonocardia sp.]